MHCRKEEMDFSFPAAHKWIQEVNFPKKSICAKTAKAALPQLLILLRARGGWVRS